MAKTANLSIRIEPDIKEQAEMILTTLGIPASNAINMFYKQIILQKGLPFDVKLPPNIVPDEEQLIKELEKGLADIESGNMRSAENVFAELREKYNL